MEPSKLKFLKSWTNELLSCANRVRDLIGDKHWLSDGHHKEYLVRAFLRKHLPVNYLISRGFVSPASNSTSASREIDVLVADSTAAVPWLNEGELIIVPPDGVVAHLHCKTTFARTELTDSLHSVDDAQSKCEGSEIFEQIWSAILFFTRGETDSGDRFLNTVTDAIKAARQGAYLPDFIVVLDGPLIILDTLADGVVQLRCFNSEPHSFALALANLFDHIASHRSPRASDWNTVLGAINVPPPVTREFKR